MKKIFIVLLLILFTLTWVVLGYTKTKNSKSNNLTEIVWQWPSSGMTDPDLKEVERQLNKMLEKDINVHVILQPVFIEELFNQTKKEIQAGNQIDLCLQINTGIEPYVSNGMIQPLNQYIDKYGQDIIKSCGIQLLGGYYKDKLYGIPVAYLTGNSYGYIARKDLLEKYNRTISLNKFYTLEEIEEIFAKIKAGEGDTLYMSPPIASNSMLNGAYCEIDLLGSTEASGVLMLNQSFSNLSIVNLFETKEYKNYANLIYKWTKEGYISQETHADIKNNDQILTSGNYLGIFSTAMPDKEAELEAVTGFEYITLKIVAPYVTVAVPDVSWQVPSTSKNVAKAVQTLNYIYKNSKASKLLQFGILGKDYEITDMNEDGEQIRFLKKDFSNLYYDRLNFIYGNRLNLPVLEPNPVQLNKVLSDWNTSISETRYSKAIGYIFERKPVDVEYTQVKKVMDYYIPIVNQGLVNPNELLPEFQKELQEAGIDKVIHENQRQLNEWKTK